MYAPDFAKKWPKTSERASTQIKYSHEGGYYEWDFEVIGPRDHLSHIQQSMGKFGACGSQEDKFDFCSQWKKN